MKGPQHRRVTVSGITEGEGKFIRNSDARHHYAQVSLRIEPNGRGMGVAVVRELGAKAIPEQYLKSVAVGISEALVDGVVPGCSVVDVVICLIGGSCHETDSQENDFKLASIFAFKDAIKKATISAVE